MDIIREELNCGLPDTRQLIHVIIRLTAAAILGAVICSIELGSSKIQSNDPENID